MASFKVVILSLLIFTLFACGGGGTSSADGSQNTLPILISGSPPSTINEDQALEFQLTVTNAVGNLNYSIQNAPSWLTISDTGLVSGMALTDADTGTFSGIVISVADSAQNSASMAPFTLQVNPVNDRPILNIDRNTLAIEARQNVSIAYSVTDEENDAFEVTINGMQDQLPLQVLEHSLEGKVADVNAVTRGTLTMTVTSLGESFSENIEITLYPLNASGLGKTIVGSKNGKGIHLVILGDGYTEQEFELYQQDALNFSRDMNSDPGIAEHMSGWNIHVVKTHSVESGVDENYGVDEVNTYFNSGYNCADIARLICANNGRIYNVLLDEYPHFDQSVLIVNGTKYGGSGGFVSIFSRTAPEIALHEMGHSFANLADEYVDDNLAESAANRYQEGDYANVSTSIDPGVVPWSLWIEDKDSYPMTEGEEGVGIFEGSLYNARGFYRPLTNSRMKTNDFDFGVVNAEQWILSIYNAAGAVSSLSPAAGEIKVSNGEAAKFSIEPIFDTKVQKIQWFVDDILQTELTNEKNVSINQPTGEYIVSVKVDDITGRVRKTSSMANFEFVWQLTVN